MDFRDALNIVTAELTPQPWDHTTPDGTTLRVIPAGLRADKGDAEVNIRITRPDASGLYSYGITGPKSRGVAEVGVTTTGLPALIEALKARAAWEDAELVCGELTVNPGAGGMAVTVTEVHSADREETVAMLLPEAQRLPLASALARALDVARSWEDEPQT
jgi:hypothetical protein